MDNAFRAYKYVPYSSLTQAAHLKAADGEEDFFINASGGFAAKGLNRKDEKLISLVEWLGAARAAEERILIHHGESRASMFHVHHQIITDLTRTHGWGIAIEYDIRQRELAAMHPEYDLSILDGKCLTLISTSLLLASQTANLDTPNYSEAEAEEAYDKTD